MVTAEQNSVRLSADLSNTDPKTGVTTKSTVVPCPDVNGSFEVSALMDVTATKGDAGHHGTVDVHVTGQVDDDAHLASSDMEFQMKWSKSSGGSSQLVDISVKIPASGGVVAAVNHTGGANTAGLEQSALTSGMIYAMSAQHFLLEAAQKGWESGRCVRLDVSPNPAPKDMEPSTTADISAAPRSKMDGGPTGGTVKATLIDGSSGVDPSATPLPADASFVFTAPSKPLNHGTVALEARSKRGVAEAEISPLGVFSNSGTENYVLTPITGCTE